jgi:hypothetical protein
MKIKAKESESFKPVELSIIIETRDEFQAFKNFMGALSEQDVRGVMNDVTTPSRKDMAYTAYNFTYEIYKELCKTDRR